MISELNKLPPAPKSETEMNALNSPSYKWNRCLLSELRNADESVKRGEHSLNIISSRAFNEGHVFDPRPQNDWNLEEVVENTHVLVGMWLDEFPSVEDKIEALIGMHEEDNHPWKGMEDYFKEVPLSTPIVSPHIDKHEFSGELEELKASRYKEFAVPSERDTKLHFSFLDEGEDEEQLDTPVVGFFTTKEIQRTLAGAKPRELAVYTQLKFMIEPDLLRSLHPALGNVVQPLALRKNENIEPIFQRNLAYALMANSSSISPIKSESFVRIESTETKGRSQVGTEAFDKSPAPSLEDPDLRRSSSGVAA